MKRQQRGKQQQQQAERAAVYAECVLTLQAAREITMPMLRAMAAVAEDEQADPATRRAAYAVLCDMRERWAALDREGKEVAARVTTQAAQAAQARATRAPHTLTRQCGDVSEQ